MALKQQSGWDDTDACTSRNHGLKGYGCCFGLGLDGDADTNYLRNVAELLEELIKSCDGRCNPIRIFSAKEIGIATNNYAVEVPPQYKPPPGCRAFQGSTHEGRAIIVVKHEYDTSSSIYRDLPSVFNVVGVLSRINHQNVVKLVGCCLETSVPLLVFEGLWPWEVLSHRIHGAEDGCPSTTPISWENRLKIATEVAYALTYLHIGTTSPIIHRDIVSRNILLGEGCTLVKIIGFNLSVSMPKGKTEIECGAIGTYGYMDPVYLKVGRLSEKSDVYSYGAVLFELLTGKKPIDRQDSGNLHWLEKFLESTEEERLVSFIDTTVLKEAKKEQVIACIQLVLRCLAETWEERPEMKQVHQELSQIKRM